MAKDKQTRTYDSDGFRRRAACLCVRDPNESEIMLVTSTRIPDYWIVPGGGIEPNEDAHDAAIRETHEEAGVKGILKRSLGEIEVCDEQNVDRKHRTSVFVLEVKEELEEWEDSKSRKRGWFSIKEALRLLAIYKPIQCHYIQLMIQTSPTSVSMDNYLLTCPNANYNNVQSFTSSSETKIQSHSLLTNHDSSNKTILTRNNDNNNINNKMNNSNQQCDNNSASMSTKNSNDIATASSNTTSITTTSEMMLNQTR